MMNNQSLPNSANVCSSPVGLSEVDTALKIIEQARSMGFMYLIIGSIIAGVTILFLLYAAKSAWGAYSSWKGYQSSPGIERYYDDVEYLDDAGYSGPVKDAQRIRQRMSSITALYSDYNKAIVRHAERKGEDPDGVMDGGIADRRNDNYKYSGDDGPRVRHNEGREHVSVKW